MLSFGPVEQMKEIFLVLKNTIGVNKHHIRSFGGADMNTITYILEELRDSSSPKSYTNLIHGALLRSNYDVADYIHKNYETDKDITCDTSINRNSLIWLIDRGYEIDPNLHIRTIMGMFDTDHILRFLDKYHGRLHPYLKAEIYTILANNSADKYAVFDKLYELGIISRQASGWHGSPDVRIYLYEWMCVRKLEGYEQYEFLFE